MERNEFLRYCRELAGDEVIDNVIWRYEGDWEDVGPRCRDAAIDGLRHRYDEVTNPDRHPGLPRGKWKDEAEHRRWSSGPQPETAMREQAIALAKMLPLEKNKYHPSVCRVCGRSASYNMDAEVHIPICVSCHTMYYQGPWR